MIQEEHSARYNLRGIYSHRRSKGIYLDVILPSCVLVPFLVINSLSMFLR